MDIKKVLLTGGTGFVGAYILQELVQKGYSVRAIKRSATVPFYIPGNILSKVEWVSGDILDVVSLQEAMQDVDAVIHAAGKVSFEGRDKHQLFRINVDGTANVVNAAIECNVPRFVHISTVGAIGRSKPGDTVTEGKKWEGSSEWNTPYGISKFHGEMEVWRGAGEGLNAVVVNPSIILGYGDWSTSSCAIFKSVYNGFPWYTKGVTGFVGVEDVAKAVVMVMQSELTGERFIINNENWTFQQMLNTIADGFDTKRPHKEASPLMGAIAWRLEKVKSLLTGKRPLLTRHSARVGHSKTFFDNSKILEQLPQFSFSPLQQSIERACQQYISHPPPAAH
jgi:nucleoside-diphosphate-sugar epimerase